jgi:hypothetical protein
VEVCGLGGRIWLFVSLLKDLALGITDCFFWQLYDFAEVFFTVDDHLAVGRIRTGLALRVL